jgi:hypothetical protein
VDALSQWLPDNPTTRQRLPQSPANKPSNPHSEPDSKSDSSFRDRKAWGSETQSALCGWLRSKLVHSIRQAKQERTETDWRGVDVDPVDLIIRAGTALARRVRKLGQARLAGKSCFARRGPNTPRWPSAGGAGVEHGKRRRVARAWRSCRALATDLLPLGEGAPRS